HQPFVSSAAVSRKHYRFAHPGILQQPRLDLAQLDPETPDLHLIVASPHEFQVAISSPLHQVSRSIEPLASCLKRLRHEAFRRLFRPPDISPRDSRSSDI